MSMSALLLAVAAKIKSATGLTDSNVGVQEDGQPPPFAGELYIAVHDGDSANDAETSLDETFGVDVTISRRAGFVPKDRVGSELIVKATTGLVARSDAIKVAIHMQYDVIIGGANAANTIIGAGANGFEKPLKFRRCTRTQRKGAEWFGAEKGQPGGKIKVLSFDGAQRVQNITGDAT